MDRLHWDILDDRRQAILPLLAAFADRGFYLAGGTGLALQIGHRDSIDFDFFRVEDFDSGALARELEQLFKGHALALTQLEANTISCVIDGAIQISLIGHRYPLVAPLVLSDHFPIASIEDIGCMKLSAITGRSVEKDYVDLYFILKRLVLTELLACAAEKYPTLDASLILKSLVYFDDVEREPILYKPGFETSFEEIRQSLETIVSAYFNEPG
jgi:hypothetical protein